MNYNDLWEKLKKIFMIWKVKNTPETPSNILDMMELIELELKDKGAFQAIMKEIKKH